MDPFDAAVAGVWIHGRAADVLAVTNDVDTYIPSDLTTAFATAFGDYRREVQSIAP
jgi:NAD(P)H-hydrate repair Nnr-like enzyme with NAD(P)H-hydrate dehydratase domain